MAEADSRSSSSKSNLNIAVIGRCGSGKSSFINTLRELTQEDDGAAETGVTETTFTAMPYKHPQNNKIVFWDFPGYCTESVGSGEHFIEQQNLDNYQIYFFLCSEKVIQDDEDVIAKLNNSNRKLFIIRNKIDQDIRNEIEDIKDSTRRKTREQKVIIELRDECKQVLKGQAIYILSSKIKNRQKWDFPKLLEELIILAPREHMSSLILSLCTNSEENVHQKIMELKKKLRSDALKCVKNQSVMPETVIGYEDVLGMSWETLSKRCYIYDCKKDKVEETWHNSKFALDVNDLIKQTESNIPESYIMQKIKEHGPAWTGCATVVMALAARLQTRAIGAAIAGPVGTGLAATATMTIAYKLYARKYVILDKIIDIYEHDAKSIINKMFNSHEAET